MLWAARLPFTADLLTLSHALCSEASDGQQRQKQG